MPSTARGRITLQTATVLLLIANFALTVNAGPIGDAGMSTSRYYWLLMLVALLLLAIVVALEKRKSPIDIVGLTYDKNTHKLELTVKNNDSSSYCIKSALRLIKPAANAAKASGSEDGVPMAAASTSAKAKRMFDLLGEDNTPVVIGPNETKLLTYDVILPAEYLKLESNNNVEVHISYGEDLRNMQGDLDEKEHIDLLGKGSGAQADKTQSEALKNKETAEEVVAEAYLIQDLIEAVKNSPSESVEFHMKDGNAIARWVREVAQDAELAGMIDSITTEIPANDLKKTLLNVLYDRVEPDTHPYLRRVGREKSFKLKLDHDKIIDELFLLEDLAEAIQNSPDQAIEFHTKNRNDFTAWVREAVGDQLLAEAIDEISGEPAEVRRQMVETVNARITQLKDLGGKQYVFK